MSETQTKKKDKTKKTDSKKRQKNTPVKIPSAIIPETAPPTREEPEEKIKRRIDEDPSATPPDKKAKAQQHNPKIPDRKSEAAESNPGVIISPEKSQSDDASGSDKTNKASNDPAPQMNVNLPIQIANHQNILHCPGELQVVEISVIGIDDPQINLVDALSLQAQEPSVEPTEPREGYLQAVMEAPRPAIQPPQPEIEAAQQVILPALAEIPIPIIEFEVPALDQDAPMLEEEEINRIPPREDTESHDKLEQGEEKLSEEGAKSDDAQQENPNPADAKARKKYKGLDLPDKWFLDSGFPADRVAIWRQIFRTTPSLSDVSAAKSSSESADSTE